MIYWTYILQGADGTYYTGITGNLHRRMTEHRQGRSKSTRNKLPVELVYTIVSTTREKARELEVKIKRRGARRWMKTYGSAQSKKNEAI